MTRDELIGTVLVLVVLVLVALGWMFRYEYTQGGTMRINRWTGQTCSAIGTYGWDCP